MSIRTKFVSFAVAGTVGVALLSTGLAWASNGEPDGEDQPIDATEGADATSNGGSEKGSVDAQRAAEMALDHTGADFADEIERERDGWKVELVAVDQRESHEVHVNRNGDVVTEEVDGADDDELRAADRKVDLAEAIDIATDRGDGAVAEADLDHDDGRLSWEVELDNDYEIDVDARDGAVVKEDDD